MHTSVYATIFAADRHIATLQQKQQLHISFGLLYISLIQCHIWSGYMFILIIPNKNAGAVQGDEYSYVFNVRYDITLML